MNHSAAFTQNLQAHHREWSQGRPWESAWPNAKHQCSSRKCDKFRMRTLRQHQLQKHNRSPPTLPRAPCLTRSRAASFHTAAGCRRIPMPNAHRPLPAKDCCLLKKPLTFFFLLSNPLSATSFCLNSLRKCNKSEAKLKLTFFESCARCCRAAALLLLLLAAAAAAALRVTSTSRTVIH